MKLRPIWPHKYYVPPIMQSRNLLTPMILSLSLKFTWFTSRSRSKKNIRSRSRLYVKGDSNKYFHHLCVKCDSPTPALDELLIFSDDGLYRWVWFLGPPHSRERHPIWCYNQGKIKLEIDCLTFYNTRRYNRSTKRGEEFFLKSKYFTWKCTSTSPESGKKF